MVNRGRSGACNTCLRRRVKCDETKPACHRCRNSNISCSGYEKARRSIKFKDQTLYALAKSERRPRGLTKPKLDGESTWKPRIQYLRESEDDQAIALFFNNIVLPGRDTSSTRGLFETIMPLYVRCSQQSPLSHAILATAMVLLMLRRGESANGVVSSKYLDPALASLRNALSNQHRSKQNETLMAIVLLQFRENIIAVRQFQEVSPLHHRGAVSLVRHRGHHNYEDEASKSLLLQVLHNEVTSAIRQGYRVNSDLVATCLRERMPSNASFELDKLGITVAEIQVHLQALNLQDPACSDEKCTHQQDLNRLHDQASAIDEDLQCWARSIPPYWQPFRLNVVPDSIPTYRNMCDIYPSVQIASIWNTWRCYRLICLKVVRTCSLGQSFCITCPNRSPSRKSDQQITKQKVQECLNSISYSIPFYLGNRCDPSEFSSNPPYLEFPGYHRMTVDERSSLHIPRHCIVLSHEEHSRHVLGQGAFHILSHLSHVLVLLADATGRSIKSCVESELIHWIGEQLVRAAFLLGSSSNMGASATIRAEDGFVSDTEINTVAQRYACLV